MRPVTPTGSLGAYTCSQIQFSLEFRIAPPTEAREGAASRILGENPCRPRALRKPLAEVADFDAIQPDRMLAVRGGDGIIELDHLLHARPLPGLGLHMPIIEEQVPRVLAV